MNVWVKICANTSLEDARIAFQSGADALGFVFAPSPRRVTVEEVAAITAVLPDSVEKIGVFVDSAVNEIAEAVRKCNLTGVQLHAQVGENAAAALRVEFGPALKILQVVHFGPDAAEQARTFAADPNVDAILVDSRTALAVGGTGITFDWEKAARTVFSGGSARRIAAGGLNPENVADAIATLKPWGVDVASGVEASLGRKDPAKVAAFVANARASANRERP